MVFKSMPLEFVPEYRKDNANSHVEYQRLSFAFDEFLHERLLPVKMISAGEHLRIPLVYLDVQAKKRTVFGKELHKHLLVAVPGNYQVRMIQQRDEEVLTPLVRPHIVEPRIGRVGLRVFTRGLSLVMHSKVNKWAAQSTHSISHGIASVVLEQHVPFLQIFIVKEGNRVIQPNQVRVLEKHVVVPH